MQRSTNSSESWIPVCLEGAYACPPDDCGVPSGFADLLEAATSPDYVQQWSNKRGKESFDPEKLDPALMNKVLKQTRSLSIGSVLGGKLGSNKPRKPRYMRSAEPRQINEIANQNPATNQKVHSVPCKPRVRVSFP